MSREGILAEIATERVRQIAKHGDQSDLPNGTGGALAEAEARTYQQITDSKAKRGGNGTITFADILNEEHFEALAESDDRPLRAELIQVAAVVVQWIEAIDRRAVTP